MSNRKKIIISIFSLALCVAVCFAWINELQNPSGRVMYLNLTDATISDSNLAIQLYVLDDETEKFNYVTSDKEEDPKLAPFANFAPGCRKKFRVDISNTSKDAVRLRLILTEIICENTELQECIVIGTNGFNGFNSNYPAPNVQNMRLLDGIDETGGFTLINSVEIPPHGKNEYVSIYFYVLFSASGSENLEDLSFSIGKINFLTL